MSDPSVLSTGGRITAVAPRSLGHKLGARPGDRLIAVNATLVEDVIDVQFYAAEYEVSLTLLRDGEEITLTGKRRDLQPLGLSFEHPTFDIDIRRCNNLCEFCFVLQMSPRFRRTLYIKDDDYRYSFLFGHFVTLTNLSEHDEWRIVNQHLSPLYVSVHATDLAVRRECLRNLDAPDIVEQIEWLTENGIDLHTQIVVTPGLNDGPVLDESVRDLAGFYPGVLSVSVVPVGLTAHHKYGLRTNTTDEAKAILNRCHAWQAEFRRELGVSFVYPTDEWYLVTGQDVPPLEAYDDLDLRENGLGVVRDFIEDWDKVKPELDKKAQVSRLTLATASLFAPTLALHAHEFSTLSGVKTTVETIVNRRLGESITVAGLLMVEDVIEQLREADLGEVVVLPRVMFDHPDGISLDDRSPADVAKTLGKPVALADRMGDLVDIIYGRPALYFDPSGTTIIRPQDIQKDGGWAVEKYL